jgi:hypothetical protein
LGMELEGRSRRQLAAELGLTEGAVRQLVHRARDAVRAAMAACVPFPLVTDGLAAPTAPSRCIRPRRRPPSPDSRPAR